MRTKVILSLIFLIALFLRFFKLSDFRCLNWDEASFTYNSYSILETGADEYGTRLPLQFKSVGDYKAPLYIYLMVPVIKVLGLNEFAIRFIPSLLGSLTVVLAYLIVHLLFKNRNLALVSSFFLAISPWHLQFTRAGADVSVSNFFIAVGILGFLLGSEGKKYGYVLSFVSFALTLYSYFGERLFSPLIVVFLIILFRKKVVRQKRNFLVGTVLSAIAILPILSSLFSGGHQEKILKTTVFGYVRPEEYVLQIRSEDKSELFYYLFHTRLFENGWGIINRYLNHFSPVFLFNEGVAKDPRQFVYGMGLMYLFDLPLLLVGVYSLVKSKNRNKYLVLGWLLLGPIPASITRDLESARRSLNMLLPLIIISSLGFTVIYDKWKRVGKNFRIILGFVVVFIFIYFVSFYFASYYVFSKNRSLAGPAGWHCGYKELVEYISPIKNEYKEVVVDTTYQGPYIFFLFYEKYSPVKYQPQAKLVQDSLDSLGEGAGYDDYTFRPIYWPRDRDRCIEGRLFAGPSERIPDRDIREGEAEIIKKIYFQNGEEAFRIVKVLKTDKVNCPDH